MKEQTIKNIIDLYLNKWVDNELNTLPIEIEPEMEDIKAKIRKHFVDVFEAELVVKA